MDGYTLKHVTTIKNMSNTKTDEQVIREKQLKEVYTGKDLSETRKLLYEFLIIKKSERRTWTPPTEVVTKEDLLKYRKSLIKRNLNEIK